MKKLTITFGEDPEQSEEPWVRETMSGIAACYIALSFDIVDTLHSSVPLGLQCILYGDERVRITREVADCNRMVAFVRLVNQGTMIEITFSSGKKKVKQLWLMYQHQTKLWTFVSES